jgi:hypothetical protein
MFNQVGDACVTVGQPPHDSQAVHVGEGLVHEAEAAELVGRIDDRRERGAQVGR